MKYSVLTYIINNYEPVREVINKDPEAEYILVTDNPDIKSNTWTVIYDESLLKMKIFERCYYVRFNPFKYCSNDIVVRIDGSMKVTGSFDKLVKKFVQDNYDLATVVHPWRDNVYDEYVAWVNSRRYNKDQAINIMNQMLKFGYHPQNEHGLFQIGFMIQKRNKINEDINSMTYSFVRYFGTDDVERVDQIIFSFVIKKFFENKVNIFPLSQRTLDSYYLSIYAHNTDKKLTFSFSNMPYADTGYVMNEKKKLYW